MIFIISFIIGFQIDENESGTIQSKKRLNIRPSERHATPKTKESLMDYDIISPMANMKKRCRIEYILMAKEDKRVIEIVLFGTCAQILYLGSSVMVKCICKNDISFVSFTVIHHADTHDFSAPIQIRGHNIKFKFFNNEMSSYKTEDRRYYFIPDGNEASDPDYGFLVDATKQSIEEYKNNMYLKCSKNDFLLLKTNKFHRRKTIMMVNKILPELQTKLQEEKRRSVLAKESFDDDQNSATESSEGSMVKKGPSIILTITGNQVISPKLLNYVQDISTSPEVTYAGLILSATKVYTEVQREFYKPLYINIRKLDSIPSTLKQNYKVKKLYLELNLKSLFESEVTTVQPLTNDSHIPFGEVFTILNNGLALEKLVEVIRWTELVIKIVGIREKQEKKHQVWGQDAGNTSFGRRFNRFMDSTQLLIEECVETKVNKKKKKSKVFPVLESTEETVVLGYATLSISEFIENVFKLVRSAAVHSSFVVTSDRLCCPFRPINTTNYHRDYRRPLKGIVSETDFNECKTSIKVEIKLDYNLSANVVCKHTFNLPYLLSVCIIIDYNKNSSYALLKEITNYNRSVFSSVEKCYQNLCLSSDVVIEFEEESEEGEDNLNFFSGFMVDAIDYTILVVENYENQIISDILAAKYRMLPTEGKLLYNSDQFYLKRRYDDFRKFGGIFVTALAVTIESVLEYSLRNKYVVPPALRCLETLRSITMASKVTSHLFPTPHELLSMDIEFGIPISQKVANPIKLKD